MPRHDDRAPRHDERGRARASIAARLTFDAVSHSYGEVEAVRGVSLDIAPAEVLCLLGPSGCGKTTLLRVAAGIERPLAGRVLINGKEVAAPGIFVPPEKRGIGLMFQDYALFPHLAILDNVMFGLKRLSRADAAREAAISLARVGLEDYAQDYPHALSGGEQQRVALARAVAPRPSVLLMDEPFSGLDKRLRDNVRDETVAVLREARATCIIVTHDPEEAMRMADRIALMRAGRLVQVGSPRVLYHAPVDIAAARFFSELNEMPGQAAGTSIASPIGVLSRPATAPEGPVEVCIRPQGILLLPAGEGTQGRVVQRRFLGEADLIEVVVDGLDRPLRARLRGNPEIVPGRDVGVGVDPAETLVFPRGPA